jgi:predicted ATPase
VPELPTGTITFLYTDIEGSTTLLQELGDAYANVLAEHRRVLEDAIARHGGAVVDTQGDALFAAFRRASDAVAAAAEAQRTLAVPVRMGIHTGEPIETGRGYVGLDVHRAARICSAAHGGQVVVSEATQRLVDGMSLLGLGEHRLKDLGEPVRLYQLGEREFPPLRTLNQTNLPVQPTPLVGRERDLDDVIALVRRADTRVVTLTGPGGAGKTRLALQAAAELADEFAHGVFFVALAPIDDPVLVVSTIAKTLGLKESEGETLNESLARYLADKELLLLLDNVERLLDAMPAVAELLREASGLEVMATSRAPLRISGELEYPVPPLETGDAVALFRDRAQRVKGDFQLTEENAETVAEVCTRLDGLPLAIELAAARAKLLPPEALLARLEQRLPLLTGGPRDAPERQRTLRATIDWSHGLLDETEQGLFARLGVFVGGCTVETAEEVCGATLDGLTSLVDKSLLRNVEGGAGEQRVSMLQTIREYAVEQLDARQEADELRQRHAEHYRALAERSEPEILRADQADWLERLQDELDNFRAALDWSTTRDPELALRLGGALRRAWVARGYLTETRARLEAALEQGTDVPASIRAKALYGLGRIALNQSDYDYAICRIEESAALFQELGDAEGIVYSLADLALIATDQEDVDRAHRLATKSLTVARPTGDETLIAAAVHSLAVAALRKRDYEEARRLFEESITRRRSVGDKRNIASSLEGLALVALLVGDYGAAVAALEEALSLGRELGNLLVVSDAISNLALVSLFRGGVQGAESLAVESLELSRDLGYTRTVIQCLHTLAAVAATNGQLSRAATLSAAAEGLHEATHSRPWAAEQLIEERFLHVAREQLSDHELQQASALGRAMALDEAIVLALEPGEAD